MRRAPALVENLSRRGGFGAGSHLVPTLSMASTLRFRRSTLISPISLPGPRSRTTHPYNYFGAKVALLEWPNVGSSASSRFGSPSSITTNYHATLVGLGWLISRSSRGHDPQSELNSGWWGT